MDCTQIETVVRWLDGWDERRKRAMTLRSAARPAPTREEILRKTSQYSSA